MRSMIVVAASLLAFVPALAEVTITYPVTIPPQCFELAQREGVPTVIQSEKEGRRAQVKLAQMRDTPMVRECRAAIARVRQQLESQSANK